MAKRTPEEIKQLKENWRRDPHWDLADSDGFEEHAAELRDYQQMCEHNWELNREEEAGKRRARAMLPYVVQVAASLYAGPEGGSLQPEDVTRIAIQTVEEIYKELGIEP